MNESEMQCTHKNGNTNLKKIKMSLKNFKNIVYTLVLTHLDLIFLDT